MQQQIENHHHFDCEFFFFEEKKMRREKLGGFRCEDELFGEKNEEKFVCLFFVVRRMFF